MSPQNNSGKAFFGAAGLLFVLGAAGVGGYFLSVKDAEATIAASPQVGGTAPKNSKVVDNSESNTVEAVDLVGDSGSVSAADSLVVVFDGHRHPISRAGLANRGAIHKALLAVKAKIDKGPVDAYLDLEAREVHAAEPGLAIDLFASVSAVEIAVRGGKSEITLSGIAVPPSVTIEDLGIDDISTVIGKFRTKFSVAEKTRNANLKLLASKINGLVLQPGQKFSFNETTGDRLLEDGFKMAHVISQGQMVDGMAGGSCQISTTLHGAAFFSGLNILKVTPHSRPSTYVAIALDATVVASKVDLKLSNPYDFPIVIHYKVARGISQVEILGREKPFDYIEFERNIDRRIPFETVTREDSSMGMGHMSVDQMGYPGYKVSRIRRTYKDGEVIKEDKWKLAYRPVVEYARLGINPNPNLPPPKKRRGHGPKPASGRFTMTQ
ncbi:MAG: VanW family protein [Kofleriaceae bacterium]|nr:VanW family protein [Kofleriaceae bacterium]